MAPVPPVMTNPDLLPAGEAWSNLCALRIHGTDKAGRPRSMTCGVKAQGGHAGLKAHIRTVHGDST